MYCRESIASCRYPYFLLYGILSTLAFIASMRDERRTLVLPRVLHQTFIPLLLIYRLILILMIPALDFLLVSLMQQRFAVTLNFYVPHYILPKLPVENTLQSTGTLKKRRQRSRLDAELKREENSYGTHMF